MTPRLRISFQNSTFHPTEYPLPPSLVASCPVTMLAQYASLDHVLNIAPTLSASIDL
ncbi:hypothetical protein BGZ60DRAFT_396690 [Tricladium varicosporioides]|nr:hypothetical protein BGZ60DRAFT_396690 [Hymenoscyphus varicosporioides]